MNRSLLWLGVALFTWGIGEGMFFLFQPIYLEQLGANPIEIGGILGAAGLVMMLVHIPSGHLADRWGRKQMLIAAWASGVLAAILMAMAKTLTVFVAGVLFYGFTAFVISPLNSYVTAARGSWSVGRAITFVGMTFNAGAVIGPYLGGWVGDLYGLRAVYSIAAGIFVISTVLILFIDSQPRDHHDLEGPPAGLMTNFRFLSFLGIYFVVIFAMYLSQPLAPNFLQNERGLSLTDIGTLGSIGGLGNTAFNFAFGMLEARAGFLLGQVGSAAYALILWQGAGFGWFALAYFTLGGFRAARNLGVALMRPLVHDSQMGLAYGVAETVGSAPLLLAPLLAGVLYAHDASLVFPVGLVLIAIGLVVSLVYIPPSGHLPVEHIEVTHEP